ncbi:MAG: histidine kinase [bacterium]
MLAHSMEAVRRRQRRQRILLVAGAWTAVGLLETGQGYLRSAMGLPDVGLTKALIGNLPWWYGWALLTPIIYWVQRRFPFAPGRVARSAAVHTVLAAAFAVLHTTLSGTVFWLTSGRFNGVPSPMVQVRNLLSAFLLEEMICYAVVVGISVAVDYAAIVRAQERERAAMSLRAAALEASVSRATLDALTMELNPHFLFNALNAVSGLVRRGDQAEAVEMIGRLGDLLRATINRDRGPECTVADELELVRHYLHIEQVRFRDRLDVVWDVDPSTDGLALPSLILQPLVENALRHGLAPLDGPGSITVGIARRGAWLVVEVRDTGIGFPVDGGIREGVGLRNTRARLAQLYGAQASLSYGPRDGGATDRGTTVRVSLPAHTLALHSASDAAD